MKKKQVQSKTNICTPVLNSTWEKRLKEFSGANQNNDDLNVTIDKPNLTKISSIWQTRLQSTEKVESRSKFRSTSTAVSSPKIEELKKQIAEERDQLLCGSSQTSYTESFTSDFDELEILMNFLNTQLKGESLSKIPLDASSSSLFTDLCDGTILCRYFQKVIPDMLDTRSIHTRTTLKSNKIDNWNACLQNARSVGCRLNVQAESLADGDPSAIQTVIYQIAKIGLETDIKIYENYLSTILPGVDYDTIAAMCLDDILLRWVNTLLKKCKESVKANNLTTDFQDSRIFIVLLKETLGISLDLSVNELERAQAVAQAASELGKGPIITLQGIVDASYWQNTLFLGSLLLSTAQMND
jgi:hypothetical protein